MKKRKYNITNKNSIIIVTTQMTSYNIKKLKTDKEDIMPIDYSNH